MGPDSENKWIPVLSNKWGRLAQGNDAVVQPTDTVEFMARSESLCMCGRPFESLTTSSVLISSLQTQW